MIMSTALIIHLSRLKNPPVMRKNKATRSSPWLDNGLAYESAVIWRIPEDLRRHEKQAAGDYSILTNTAGWACSPAGLWDSECAVQPYAKFIEKKNKYTNFHTKLDQTWDVHLQRFFCNILNSTGLVYASVIVLEWNLIQSGPNVSLMHCSVDPLPSLFLVRSVSAFEISNFNMGQDYASDGTARETTQKKTKKHSFIPGRSSTLEVWE